MHDPQWDLVLPLGVININLNTLKGVIEDELRTRTFSYIPRHERTILLETQQLWPPVWQKFQSVKGDAELGAEAYAHGLYAACVFHMMLVLERGLASLAAALKVKGKNWGEIINSIERAITALGASAKATPKGTKPVSKAQASKRADLLTFYAESAKEFVYFKDAWRNHVAHGRSHYEKSDALKVMVHVRDFMLHLSGRLQERKR
jgi:hypothetical protein